MQTRVRVGSSGSGFVLQNGYNLFHRRFYFALLRSTRFYRGDEPLQDHEAVGGRDLWIGPQGRQSLHGGGGTCRVLYSLTHNHYFHEPSPTSVHGRPETPHEHRVAHRAGNARPPPTLVGAPNLPSLSCVCPLPPVCTPGYTTRTPSFSLTATAGFYVSLHITHPALSCLTSYRPGGDQEDEKEVPHLEGVHAVA